MRRIACTATLSIFLFLAGLATTSAASQGSSSVSVNATADSSGVSIIINQSSVSLNGDTSGTISITVSTASTEQSLVCTLEPGSGNVDILEGGDIDVHWTTDDGMNLSIVAPSIRLASLLSNFSCEPAD
jgi:proline racemase